MRKITYYLSAIIFSLLIAPSAWAYNYYVDYTLVDTSGFYDYLIYDGTNYYTTYSYSGCNLYDSNIGDTVTVEQFTSSRPYSGDTIFHEDLYGIDDCEIMNLDGPYDLYNFTVVDDDFSDNYFAIDLNGKELWIEHDGMCNAYAGENVYIDDYDHNKQITDWDRVVYDNITSFTECNIKRVFTVNGDNQTPTNNDSNDDINSDTSQENTTNYDQYVASSKITGTKINKIKNKKFRLKWQGINGAQKYKIQIFQQKKGHYKKIKAFTITNNKRIYTAKNSGTYRYRVRAIRGNILSGWSKWQQFVVK